jgi:hypothetical protein
LATQTKAMLSVLRRGRMGFLGSLQSKQNQRIRWKEQRAKDNKNTFALT